MKHSRRLVCPTGSHIGIRSKSYPSPAPAGEDHPEEERRRLQVFDEIMLTVERMRVLVRLLDSEEADSETISTGLYWLWEQFDDLQELLEAYQAQKRKD